MLRWKRTHNIVIVVSVMCLCLLFATSREISYAQETKSSLQKYPTLDEAGRVELLRCLFSEKRLVIRFEEKISVVHEGESLPGDQLRIESITDDRLVLAAGASTVKGNNGSLTIPQKMILIQKENGGLKITRFSDHPEDMGAVVPVVRSTSVFVPTSPDGEVSLGPVLNHKSY
jgi:hypothetical protein